VHWRGFWESSVWVWFDLVEGSVAAEFSLTWQEMISLKGAHPEKGQWVSSCCSAQGEVG